MEFLKGKPASVISVVSGATYPMIVKSIQSDRVEHDSLRSIKQMCQQNPTVLCVVYRSFENSVLVIHGEKPSCTVFEGCHLVDVMARHSKENHIYVFTYVK